MQMLLSRYQSVFPRLPFALRVLVNLIMAVFLMPRMIYVIVKDHFSSSTHQAQVDQSALDEQLSIEVLADELDPLEQVEAHCETLSREERWDDLHRLMSSFDKRRAIYGGSRLATIAGIGARARQTRHLAAFGECVAVPEKDLDTTELNRLEAALAGRPDDHFLAGITAHSHVEMAWALRGGDAADTVSEAGWEGYARHIQRAAEIMEPFDAQTLDSPYVALINHVIAPNLENAAEALDQSFDICMALDPYDWDVMARHAFHLLPRWYGDYDQIEVKARSTMALTQATAGASAYAAFYLGVLSEDEGAIMMVEPPLLLQGLRDMIDHGERDPAQVNKLIATCFRAFAPQFSLLPGDDPLINEKRVELGKIPNTLIRECLDAHVPQAWPIEPGIMRHLVGIAYERELARGAKIKIETARITISEPKPDPET